MAWYGKDAVEEVPPLVRFVRFLILINPLVGAGEGDGLGEGVTVGLGLG